MRRSLGPPRWLPRGVEGAAIAGLVALGALAALRLSAGGDEVVIPTGLAGSMLLAAPVLALAVIAPAYPVALAGTREDAILGAFAAGLIAFDGVALLAPLRLAIGPAGGSEPGGLLIGLYALGPALSAVAAGQLLSALGFGRRAGAWTATTGALAAVAVLVVTGSGIG